VKNPVYLDVLLSFNAFTTVIQVFKRFPLLSPFQYLFAPLAKLSSFAAMEKTTRLCLERRIDRGGNTEHLDFFEYILPADSPLPTDPRELTHLGSVAVQVMFAEFGPISDWFYGTLFFLLEEAECYKLLSEEIRNAFKSYDDIKPGVLASLPYLHACLEESLRVLSGNNTGLPRISPGALVDGHYVPKGVRVSPCHMSPPPRHNSSSHNSAPTSDSPHLPSYPKDDKYNLFLTLVWQAHVQTSIFALARSPRYFHDPLHYRPQRWLPSDHPHYDAAFANDNRKGLFSFSLGPRVCMGREMAWMQGRLFMAKVLWTFDVVKVPGQHVDLEGALLHYGFLVKPELKVRFVPVSRKKE
jgi:cytochrome P450